MTKSLLTVGIVLSAAASSFAAPCALNQSGQVSTTLNQFLPGGTYTGCTFGDKIISFSNYNSTYPASNIDINISKSQGDLVYSSQLVPLTPITTTLAFTFNIAIDPTVNPAAQIVTFKDQIDTAKQSGGQPLPNASTATFNGTGGLVSLSGTAGNETGQTGLFAATTAFQDFSYNPSGGTGSAGQLNNIGITVTQAVQSTVIPEPASMGLIGLALMGLAMTRKRRMA
jgi:hypothetical protein